LFDLDKFDNIEKMSDKFVEQLNKTMDENNVKILHKSNLTKTEVFNIGSRPPIMSPSDKKELFKTVDSFGIQSVSLI